MKHKQAAYVKVGNPEGFSYTYVKVLKGKHPRYEIYRANDGYRWRLRAANSQIVATGEAHTRKRDAVRACQRIADLADEAANVPLKDA